MRKLIGVLILLNTMGGDVEAGLCNCGDDSILLVSRQFRLYWEQSFYRWTSRGVGRLLFIVPSGTMIVHPVRSTGMFIGVLQSYKNMERTQDRITRFLAEHSRISQDLSKS